MTFRSSHDTASRAVRSLTRETAALPLPPLDWDAIEKKLLAQVVAEAQMSSPAERSPRPSRAIHMGTPWSVALAAAAAVALVAGSSFTSRHRSANDADHAASAAGAEGVRGITLGDTLKVGDTVVSKDRSLAYQKAGLVTFTLAPESSIEILTNEKSGERPGPLTIGLGRGSVHAEVTPQSEGEVFAVEVGHTRVAVHGTSFTVSREADRVMVEVMHGSVAVGPTGHPGATQGWLLVGPEHATFSLDGARDVQWLPAPSQPSEPGARSADRTISSKAPRTADAKPAKGAPAAPASPAHAGRRLAPEHADSNRATDESSPPTDESNRATDESSRATDESSRATDESSRADETATIETPEVVDPHGLWQRDKAKSGVILKQLEACYRRQVSSFGVSYSIRSSLRLSILPTGAIREGVFDPPLSPTLMTCARQAITSVRFAKASSLRQIQVSVNLSPAE